MAFKMVADPALADELSLALFGDGNVREDVKLTVE